MAVRRFGDLCNGGLPVFVVLHNADILNERIARAINCWKGPSHRVAEK